MGSARYIKLPRDVGTATHEQPVTDGFSRRQRSEASRRATAPHQHEAKPVILVTLAGLVKSSNLNAAVDEIAKVLRGRR